MRRLTWIGVLLQLAVMLTANASGATAVRNPHIVHLIFYLSNCDGPKDAEAITNSLRKVKSTDHISLDLQHGWLLVDFDSHAVSYHQAAQGIADAGAITGKVYDPRLKVFVPDYATGTNAARVDAVFAGKRLNQRVRIEPVDKTAGVFLVHFLKLKLDPAETGPQGFNGGHLNHPISDPPPRGLGLRFVYAAKDEEQPPKGKSPAPAASAGRFVFPAGMYGELEDRKGGKFGVFGTRTETVLQLAGGDACGTGRSDSGTASGPKLPAGLQ